MYQGILIFLVCGLYADGKWSFFWMSFFLFCKGMFQKTAKKKWDILRLKTRKFAKISKNMRNFLTEHPFTDRSALYRIPLELVKNRKLHNEMLFF